MNKLSKADVNRRDELAKIVREKQDAANQAVVDFNEALKKVNEMLAAIKLPVETAVAELNEAIDDGNTWMEAVKESQQSFFDERSEKWQEGERGSAYSDWMGLYGEPVNEAQAFLPDAIDDLDEDFGDFAVYLEELPESPG